MDVIMPQLGETVAEGTVAKWYKKVGDTVRADEPLFDVETDKVNMEIPAPVAGVLSEIIVMEGTTVKVGVRIAVIGEANAATASTADAPATASTSATPRAAAMPAPEQAQTAALAAGGRLSPVVRRLCAEHAIDPARIRGSGRDGRVTRDDVLAHIAAKQISEVPEVSAAPAPSPLARTAAIPAAASASPRGAVAVALNSVRRRTAEQVQRAWTAVPHVLQLVEADFSGLDTVRRAYAATWNAREGFSLTYLPFIARAVSVALVKFPNLNATFNGDALLLHPRVNLGIAVDLALDGLVVPVVKDVQTKSIVQIAREINDLAQRARSGKLKPDDVSEGTYTISNNGAFGTVITAPIINFPQVATLSTDAVRKKPVVIEAAAGDSIAIRPIGVLAQSFDHRAVDGAYSASFLQELKTIVETRNWRQDLEI
jgi:pyruvate dehydrogenase E2 component (dihydrolipoamide acetyltransferase)